jgi:hypothetical protein
MFKKVDTTRKTRMTYYYLVNTPSVYLQIWIWILTKVLIGAGKMGDNLREWSFLYFTNETQMTTSKNELL